MHGCKSTMHQVRSRDQNTCGYLQNFAVTLKLPQPLSANTLRRRCNNAPRSRFDTKPQQIVKGFMMTPPSSSFYARVTGHHVRTKHGLEAHVRNSALESMFEISHTHLEHSVGFLNLSKFENPSPPATSNHSTLPVQDTGPERTSAHTLRVSVMKTTSHSSRGGGCMTCGLPNRIQFSRLFSQHTRISIKFASTLTYLRL